MSCNNVTTTSGTKNLGNDSVMIKLKQLKETELTRIEINPTIYYADTISKGQTIEGKFTITNKGKNPFFIKKIMNVCDCTVSESTKSKTLPNDSCIIRFKIDTENFSDGFNVRVITVMGNFHPFFRVLSVECYVKK